MKDCSEGKAMPYHLDIYRNYTYTKDISNNLVGNGHTVIMTAIQFFLLTGINDIYIAGVDCSGSRINETNKKEYNIQGWIELKKWLKDFPKVKLSIINPVGLKGLFNDIYETQ